MTSQQVDKVVVRTAKSIAAALDKMVTDLPEGAAPQMAIELVIKKLALLEPSLMQLIMEDYDIREAYAEAVASVPIKAKG
jgi:hypothetical protein